MSPRLTGLPAISKTIGMVVVAAFTARARGSAGRGNHGYLTTDQFAAIADR